MIERGFNFRYNGIHTLITTPKCQNDYNKGGRILEAIKGIDLVMAFVVVLSGYGLSILICFGEVMINKRILLTR